MINTNEIPVPKHSTFINGFSFAEKRDLLCNHSNDDHSSCQDNMLFPCVRISRFLVKADLEFIWCLCNK